MICSKQSTLNVINKVKNRTFQLVTVLLLSLIVYTTAYAQADTTLKNTLPAAGKLVNGKPVGKGWVDMLANADDWNFENTFWQLSNHILHGSMGREKEHHYSYTKKTYTDFELNVM